MRTLEIVGMGVPRLSSFSSVVHLQVPLRISVACAALPRQLRRCCQGLRAGNMGPLTNCNLLQVPLWFCVACPAVLGLLAPLVINAGLGALADAACRHWQLPSDECNDLW